MSQPSVTESVRSDRDLVAQMGRGRQEALRTLYARYGSAVFAVAHRIIGEESDADDVVVEAFTQAWRQAARYDATRGSVGAWLLTITRSRALDLVRARRRRDAMGERAAREDASMVPGMGTPHPEADIGTLRGERQARVREAIENLTDAQRAAIELAYFEGLSQSEVAERLGEPLGTVKTRIRSGMQKLRDTLRPLIDS